MALTELKGGSNRVFRIDLADGSALVLKTYDDVRGKLPIAEAYAAGLLAGLDLPVTRYLLVDETQRRLPFRFVVTNHLPGVPVQSVADAPDIADAYRQMGAALRQLHKVKLAGYGRFGDGGLTTAVATNAEFVRRRAKSAFAEFRRSGASEELAHELEVQIDRTSTTPPGAPAPCSLTTTFIPTTCLVVRDGDDRLQLSGIIDLGNALCRRRRLRSRQDAVLLRARCARLNAGDS